jgi:hypothetical protein
MSEQDISNRFRCLKEAIQLDNVSGAQDWACSILEGVVLDLNKISVLLAEIEMHMRPK